MIVTTYKPTKLDMGPHPLTTNQKILLMPLGDVHEGSDGWPKKKFIDHLHWGLDRGATFLGMGEAFDFTSTSQRALMAPLRDSTKKQLDQFILDRVEKFADMISFTKGRWIGMLEGDHYWQFETGDKAGFSSDQVLCQLLSDGAERKCIFLGGPSAYIRINFGIRNHPEADCTIYAHHGIGGGRTAGGGLNRVEDLIKTIEADIYLMGHIHSKVNDPIDRLYITKEGVCYHRTKFMARTGGWLRGYVNHSPRSLTTPAVESRGSYVERKSLMPTSLGGLAIGIGYDQVDGGHLLFRPTIHCSI